MFWKNKAQQPQVQKPILSPEEEIRLLIRRRHIRSYFWTGLWCVTLIGIVLSVYFLGQNTLNLILEKTLYTNKMFTLRQVELLSFGQVNKESVLDFLGIQVYRDNLMALDLNRMKRKLEHVSVIESASFERGLPDTLRIQVYARTPVIRFYRWVLNTDTLTDGNWEVCFLDEDGYVIAPDDYFCCMSDIELSSLPMLVGVYNKNMKIAGEQCKNREVLNVLKFMKLYKKLFFSDLEALVEIDIGNSGFLIAKTVSQMEIILDPEELELGLARWEKIYRYGMDHNLNIGRIDLSVSNNVPVTWFTSVQTGERVSSP